MTLAELARRLRKATATVYGWADTGILVKGERVKLATVRIGGRRHVTATAYREFQRACNPEPAAAMADAPTPRAAKPTGFQRRAEAAQKRAAEMLKGLTK